jgi:hypothetical protein
MITHTMSMMVTKGARGVVERSIRLEILKFIHGTHIFATKSMLCLDSMILSKCVVIEGMRAFSRRAGFSEMLSVLGTARITVRDSR